MLVFFFRRCALPLAALLFTSWHVSAQISFDTPDFPTGDSPVGIASADFNHDGIPDVVTVNQKGHSISVLLGKKGGTLGPKTDYPVGTLPVALVASDFNSDGVGDVAVLDQSDGVVSIFLGKGDGTLGDKTDYVVDTGGNSLLVADFNGDGIPDLAVSSGSANSISVLLGKGDGTFAPKQDFPAGASPTSLVSGDFNQDGKIDLAVVNENSNSVSVLLANGDGTFNPPASFAVSGVTAIAVGDFNNDGKNDLLVFFQEPVQLGSVPVVSFYQGHGDGTFSATGSPLQISGRPGPVGDFDGDGNADFALNEGPLISIYRGHGDGTFSLVDDRGNLNGGATAIAAADFDGDGHLDLATANFTSTASIVLNNGNGTFRSRHRYNVSNAQLQALTLAVADLNRDGVPDLAVAHRDVADISIFFANGDGTFSQGQTINVQSAPCALAAGDFNGDGIPDLVYVFNFNHTEKPNSAVAVLLNNGNGTFQPPLLFPIPSLLSCAMAVGDFNEDGKLDLAFTDGINKVSILLGNGDGTFQNKTDFTVGQAPSAITVADFNLDGHLDLAVTNNNDGDVAILYGQGNGSFGPPMLLASGRAPSSIVSGDFNGDGLPDLAVVNSADNQVAVFLGLRMGQGYGWSSRTLYDTGLRPQVILAGDFDGDGVLDLVVGNNGVDAVSVLRGNGDGTFQPKLDFVSGVPNPVSVATGDFNNDGKLDLVALNNRAFDVLFNASNGTPPPGCDAPGTPGIRICEPGDNAKEGTSVRIVAAATIPDFALLRVYENNRNIYDTTNPNLDVNLGLVPGLNHLVIVVYSTTGQFYSVERLVDSSGSGAALCTTPATDQTIEICYPNENTNTGATFQLQAHARWNNTVITHMRVYIDDQPVYDEDTPADGYINPVLTISPGTHKIVVVAWNGNGEAIVSPTRSATFFQ